MSVAGGMICSDEQCFDAWKDQVLVSLDQPWSRVKEPVPIPVPTTAPTLQELSEQDLARLLRDHLVPRQTTGVERTKWESLWRVLSADDDLAERAFDVLEDFLTDVEQALQADGLDEHTRKRMEKFRRFCDDAWQRLRLHHSRPLSWAGRAGAGFNPAGRVVISRLVDAIARHRALVQDLPDVRDADLELWQVLKHIGLDPDQASRNNPS